MFRYFLIFVFGFAILGAGIWEVYLRGRPLSEDARSMDCLRLGGPEHHDFQPNCEAKVVTPAGTVNYSLNEDGFRARRREEYRKGAVAFVGDSKVEGWWLNQDDTLGAGLERAGALHGLRELNLGVRFSGPSIQRLRLERALANYPVKAVVWLLNGTDPVDERLADSLALRRDSNGAPLELGHDEMSPPTWLRLLQEATHYRSALLRMVQMKLYDREVMRRVLGPHSPGVACQALHSAVEILRKKKIPLLAVYLPLGPNIQKYPYMNLVGREDGSREVDGCFKSEGITAIDLRGQLDERPEFYWSVHRNMTAAGMKHLISVLSPKVGPALERAWRSRDPENRKAAE